MNASFLRLFVVVFIAVVLCFPAVLTAQEGEKINLFKTNPNAPKKNIKRDPDGATRQVRNSLRYAFDPETKQTGEALKYFAVSFTGLLVVVGGFVYWQIWRQKHLERALKDPTFLVQELNNVHRLSEPEKRLMQELSNNNDLSSPLDLFVEPKFLVDAYENEEFVSARPVMRHLLSKLFDISIEGGGDSTASKTIMESAVFSSKTKA
jgi:hypothetical protein